MASQLGYSEFNATDDNISINKPRRNKTRKSNKAFNRTLLFVSHNLRRIGRFFATIFAPIFASIFAPIFHFLMELELKLEWLEGVSKILGRLVYFVPYLNGGRTPPL